jgi:type IV secretion/conjugal transfer VirB4 family ATPase
MVHLRRLLKDHHDTGTVASLLALWGFVDGRTFLTKAGAVGVAFRLRGVDDECLDHDERRAITLRFEQALRYLDETFRVYQYLIKRPAPAVPGRRHQQALVDQALRQRAAALNHKQDELFDIDSYLVILYEGWATGQRGSGSAGLLRFPCGTLGRRLSVRDTIATLDAGLRQAVETLHHHAHTFAAQLADTVSPELLEKDALFTFLRRLVNYVPHKVDGVRLRHDTHLDFYVSDSEMECHRDHLRVDGVYVKALTMKDPPATTFAHMLRDVCAIPGEFIACLEWQRIPHARIRREIHARRRHFFNKKVSLINYVQSQTKSDDMLVDDSATATVQELGRSLTDLDVHGRCFGACSVTLVLHGRDQRRVTEATAEAVKVFAAHDGVLYEESVNLLHAWLAMVPGNHAHNLRRLALLNTNAADLSFLFSPAPGHRTSAHLTGQPCLAVLETATQCPFGWTLHVDDVGHTLIQGATGAGKSFLTTFVLIHAQQYDPVTVIFDLGGGYDRLTRRLGGSAFRMSLTDRPFTINPFCLPPTDEHRHFLFSFGRVLMQASGTLALTLKDDREIYEAIGNIYTLDPPQRRLFTLTNLLPRPLALPLARWVQGGPYASCFDHADDTLTFKRIQAFDFEGLERLPAVLEPLLFYVLHRANATIRDRAEASTLKLFVLDEAWRFVRDPVVKQYITEALKTWRKRNAAMILATQSAEDVPDPDLLRTILESCPTKIFLANPGIDPALARERFLLNYTEAARIATLRPRQDLLLKRPGLSKVVQLNVEPESHWIYAQTDPPAGRASLPADARPMPCSDSKGVSA